MRAWPELRTERLLMHGWTSADRDAFAAVNSDPRVMEYLGGVLAREQSDAMVDRIEAKFQRDGVGLWAVETLGEARFVGMVGLSVPTFEAPFMPAVEVGWRLDAGHWGNGYATEAARAALEFGFEVAGLQEIVSFTTRDNARSRRVMERLGMTRDPRDDFGHPSVSAESRLHPHVLYRIRRDTQGAQH